MAVTEQDEQAFFTETTVHPNSAKNNALAVTFGQVNDKEYQTVPSNEQTQQTAANPADEVERLRSLVSEHE